MPIFDKWKDSLVACIVGEIVILVSEVDLFDVLCHGGVGHGQQVNQD